MHRYFFLLFILVIHSIRAYGIGVDVRGDRVVQQDSHSIVREIRLYQKTIGEFRIFKKDPISTTRSKPMATLFILAGVETGASTVHLFPSMPGVSLVSMDYLKDVPANDEKRAIEVLKNLPRIEMQILLAYRWLLQQHDVDATRLSSVNISFGSFVAPHALQLLGEMGVYPKTTVFLFGGALLPKQLRHLRGPFLVVRGLYDEIIPLESAQALQKYLPQPKTVVELPVQHIGPDRPEVIQQTLPVVARWLLDNGAL